jgi:cytidylate kinase
LTIAVSREAGSRGGSIARRAARKLGWRVYTQDVMEYIAQEGAFRQEIADTLEPPLLDWVDQRLQALLKEQSLSQHPSLVDLARIVLGLGARGEVVLVGRGAGSILPSEATLHVRIIAPLADRIAYMSQWMRLTLQEASEQVRLRDGRRAEFVETHFHRRPGDVYQYDLLLNSSLLGEELCAELIVQAARAKIAARHPPPTPASPWAPDAVG